MDMLVLIKKVLDFADAECGVDDIPENDYKAYAEHRESCISCCARDTINNIGEELYFFNNKFKVEKEK